MVWGAVAAVAATQLIGALWYSPYVFGNHWIRATFPGRSKEYISQTVGSACAMTLVSSAGLSLMLHIILVNFFQVKCVMEAVKFSFGLASLTGLIGVPHLAFSQRSISTFIIDHVFDTVSLVVMALCIFYLK